MKEELSVMAYLFGIIYFCYMKIRNLFLYANNILWYPHHRLSAGEMFASHIPHLNPAAVLGRCWWDCSGVYLHESKTRVQNIFFSLNFPLICSQICLCLLNAFLLEPFLVKPHYNFVLTWTHEGSLQHLSVELAPNLQRTSQTGVNHIITDCTACRIMPWEQRWQFLNCEITQAELGMHCVFDVVCTQKCLKVPQRHSRDFKPLIRG